MNTPKNILILSTSLLLLVTGCGESNDAAVEAQPDFANAGSKPIPDGSSPGKPSAPISIDYEIIGNPVVGQPVLINLKVRSDDGPVRVAYSIADTSAMHFQAGQVEHLEIADPSLDNIQQLAVVPMREGRSYVNVAVEVVTADGSMIRSMAIPVGAGKAPSGSSNQGTVTVGPDGEAVQSMPAAESN